MAFSRDGVFFHPELRFRFTPPSDWQAQNLARAVIALAPRGSAALQLTLAGDVRPEEATRRFLSQRGIRALASGREMINGIPATVSVFDAQTPDGAIRGMLAHLAYSGRTYQLAAYSAPGNFGAYERAFERTIASFGPVRDREVLAVQPKRIDVLRLARTMSLAEFARTHRPRAHSRARDSQPGARGGGPPRSRHPRETRGRLIAHTLLS
jgi:predicted Zn-dependent protease